jgi:hypothetical protein
MRLLGWLLRLKMKQVEQVRKILCLGHSSSGGCWVNLSV